MRIQELEGTVKLALRSPKWGAVWCVLVPRRGLMQLVPGCGKRLEAQQAAVV